MSLYTLLQERNMKDEYKQLIGDLVGAACVLLAPLAIMFFAAGF